MMMRRRLMALLENLRWDDREEPSLSFLLLTVLKNNSAVQSGHDWTSAIYKIASRITELPIAIKGIQGWEDATLCMEYGFQTMEAGN
ncbi:unnamed protein product [Aspergillus oryzae]|nr:unnamed protein product [Aspergillus oryzae]GMF93994.1 unnamed protein product [Aspergillus oryzae]